MPGAWELGRILLTMVFLVAAVAKLRDFEGSRRAIADFGLPLRAAPALAIAIPLGELLVAAALALGPTAGLGAVAALALLLTFALAIAWNLLRGHSPDCRCFGQLHSAPVGLRTIARNLALALLAFAIAGAHDLWTWAGAIVAIAALASAVLVAQSRSRRLRRATDDGDPAVATAAAIGVPAPAFDLPDATGRRQTPASLAAGDRPLLLLFSDTNCGPCGELAPEVARWQKEHADAVRIAVIERDASGSKPPETDEFGRRDVLRQDEPELGERYGVLGTPSGVLVAADGTIASPVAAGGLEIEALLARTVVGFEQRLQPSVPADRPPLRRRELLVRAGGAWAATGFVLAWPGRAVAALGRGERPCPKPWQLRCGGRCYSVLIDRDHCGNSCGNLRRCKSGLRRREVCAGGKCIADTDGQFPCNVARPAQRSKRGIGGETPHQCPGNQICCQGNCVDPTRTPNCGACGQQPPGRRPACCQGAPRDLSRDPRHCGACFHRCPDDKPLCYAPAGVRTSEACRATCGPRLKNCGTKDCYDPRKEVCCKGRIYPKKGGIRECRRQCVDTKSDPDNCGDCGVKCEGYECCSGKCCSYNADTCCPGGCKNLAFDHENCGACGNVCGPNSYCRFGVCTCPVEPCP